MGSSYMRSNRSSDRGAAAVETALILPMLLLIVFGIIDFGRMLNAQITLTEAAREGARAVALNVDPEPRIGTATQRLGALGTDVTWTEVQGCASSPDPEDDAEVVVSYTFSFITPVGALAGIFTGGGFGADVSMSGTGVMPCRA
jgi:Flp pilus assembly protein TadG